MGFEHDDDRAPADPFAERLAEAYGPGPMTEGEANAFDARLKDRLERRRWRPAGALAAVAVAASLVAAVLLYDFDRPEADVDWLTPMLGVEYEDLEEVEAADDGDGDMPAEYEALALLFSEEETR